MLCYIVYLCEDSVRRKVNMLSNLLDFMISHCNLAETITRMVLAVISVQFKHQCFHQLKVTLLLNQNIGQLTILTR